MAHRRGTSLCRRAEGPDLAESSDELSDLAGGPLLFQAMVGPAMFDVVLESTRTFTQAEFARQADWLHRWSRPLRVELLHGRIVMTPPAGYPHGEIAANIVRILGTFVHAGAKGKVFDSSQGFELPSGDTVEPDVTFISIERWSAAPPPEDGAFLRVVPDLVVEILSPSTASKDRGEKKAIYEQNGVREYWLVDRTAREIVAFTIEDGGRYGQERVFAERERPTSFVLAGLAFDVAEVLP